MSRKGLSFTLTLVVVGVVLLMTALTVVTLGGSSLSNFFGFFADQGEQAEINAEIRDQCQQLAQDVEDGFCDQYMLTAQYDADYGGGQWNTTVWNGNDAYFGCPSSGQQTRQVRSTPPADGDQAYEDTYTSRACDWVEHSDFSPTVTVRGETYNCVEEGLISATCPAQ